jgi:hypothetical protein
MAAKLEHLLGLNQVKFRRRYDSFAQICTSICMPQHSISPIIPPQKNSRFISLLLGFFHRFILYRYAPLSLLL